MLSIIIPVYNERESLALLHNELSTELNAEFPADAEIIFVDDGSSDGSWETIEHLAMKDSRVRGIKFRRNFGKATALDAGFSESRGEIIFTMDADLQDNPKELKSLLRELNKGCDMVTGWKKLRLDPWHKIYPSWVFNRLVGTMTGLKLHDHNCGLKLYKREVVESLHLYGELHRFTTVMAHAAGFKVTEIEVTHRPRKFGASKYGFIRFFHGILDLLTVRFMTGYGDRPLHFLGFLGIGFTALGGTGLAYLAVLRLLGEGIGHRPLLSYSVGAMLLGVQMVTFGILAELILWRSARATHSAGKSAIILKTI